MVDRQGKRKCCSIKKGIIGLIVLLFTITSAYAQTAELIQITKQFDDAVLTDNLQLARSAHDRLSALETDEHDSDLIKYRNYYLAYSYYRLGSSFTSVEKQFKTRYLDKAIDILEDLTTQNGGFAEAQALLANCYGMKTTGFFSALKYGRKSEAHLETALELAPDNPRVVMIDAISRLFKPAFVGGSTEEAIEGFKKTIDLFKSWSSSHNLSPNWGAVEVYVWLGQAYVKQGAFNKARNAYETALEHYPDFRLVKEKLLPELEAKEKAG